MADQLLDGQLPVRAAYTRCASGWLLGCLLLIGCLVPLQLAQAQEPDGLKAAVVLEAVVVDAVAKAERSVVAIARLRKDVKQPKVNQPVGKNKADGAETDSDSDPLHPDFVPHDFGSGVVVDATGLILTNYHVLGDLEKSSYLVWIDRKPYPAKVKAADPWLDLAVLKIEATDLIPIVLGNAAKIKKGQIVLTLGNPYAIARDGQPSAAWGIVSNLSRQAPAPTAAARAVEGRETLHHYGTLIQTDARLELGSSGGALVNLKGEMIGLTTSLAALMGFERAGGYAVPVDDDFKRAVDALKKGKMPEYGFLGVAPAVLSAEERRAGRFGARIGDVVPSTPAAKAGLESGDVVTHVDGEAISDDVELIRRLSGKAAGATVELSLLRPTKEGELPLPLKAPVVLSKKQIEGSRVGFAEFHDPLWRGLRVDYATASPGFRENSRDLDEAGCVGVVEVQRDSLAWKSGLRPGDFISQVGPTHISTPQQFTSAISKIAKEEVALTLTGSPDGPKSRTIPAEAAATP